MELVVRDVNVKPHVREGLYHAELRSIREVADGPYGARLALVFSVYTNPQGQPVELAMVCYKQLTPKSKLSQALQPLGVDIRPGQRVDTDRLVGNPCRVFVQTYKTADGASASAIETVLEADEHTRGFLSAAKKAAPPAQAQAPVEEVLEGVE